MSKGKQEDKRDDKGRRGREEPERQKHWGRTLAEWTTLGISLVIVVGTTGYLLYQETKHEDRIIAVEVRPKYEEAKSRNGTFVLPVEVINPGGLTLRQVKVTASHTDDEGRLQSTDQSIEYLGEQSTETVYFYFKADPRRLGVEVQADGYSLE